MACLLCSMEIELFHVLLIYFEHTSESSHMESSRVSHLFSKCNCYDAPFMPSELEVGIWVGPDGPEWAGPKFRRAGP